MNVLIEIGHPAHVHFFRDAIRNLPKLGHTVSVISRNKDITNRLLEREGIAFDCFSSPAQSLPGLMKELSGRWWKTGRMIHRQSVDLAVSISGITTSLPARIQSTRNLVFTDTEDATLSNRIAFPFADVIWTPRFFLRNLGKKHRRYLGLHELAYLQDFDFDEATQVRSQMGLPEKYFFLRVVANDALHDRSIQGLRTEDLRSLIGGLKNHGEVFLSSEAKLPADLETYRTRFPIEKVHAVMAGAQAFIGESPTMAVESSLLGTPAALISGRCALLGNMVGLEKEFNLLKCFASWGEFSAPRFLEAHSKAEWHARAQAFRQESPAMRPFILNTLMENLG